MNDTAVRFDYPDSVVAEYDHWLVLVRRAQLTAGSLVLATSTAAEALSALPPAAFTEMAGVCGAIESVLARVVRYEKINYLLLMMADPHVHYHVIPRYPGTRTVGALSVEDTGWPRHPLGNAVVHLDDAGLRALRDTLRSHWPDSFAAG